MALRGHHHSPALLSWRTVYTIPRSPLSESIRDIASAEAQTGLMLPAAASVTTRLPSVACGQNLLFSSLNPRADSSRLRSRERFISGALSSAPAHHVLPSGREKKPSLSIVILNGLNTILSNASSAFRLSAAVHSPRNSSVMCRFSLGTKDPEDDLSWSESRSAASSSAASPSSISAMKRRTPHFPSAASFFFSDSVRKAEGAGSIPIFHSIAFTMKNVTVPTAQPKTTGRIPR